MMDLSKISKVTWAGLAVVGALVTYIFWPKKAHAAVPVTPPPSGVTPPKPPPVPTPPSPKAPDIEKMAFVEGVGKADGYKDGYDDAINGRPSGTTKMNQAIADATLLPDDYKVGYVKGYEEGYADGMKSIAEAEDLGGDTWDATKAAWEKTKGAMEDIGASITKAAEGAGTTTTAPKSTYSMAYDDGYKTAYPLGQRDAVNNPDMASTFAKDGTLPPEAAVPPVKWMYEGADGKNGVNGWNSGVRQGYSDGVKSKGVAVSGMHVGQAMAREDVARQQHHGAFVPDYWWRAMPRVTPAHLGVWTPPARGQYARRN